MTVIWNSTALELNKDNHFFVLIQVHKIHYRNETYTHILAYRCLLLPLFQFWKRALIFLLLCVVKCTGEKKIKDKSPVHNWRRIYGPWFEQLWIVSILGYFVPLLFEIGPVVIEKKLKMWKVYRRSDDRQLVIRKSHLRF